MATYRPKKEAAEGFSLTVNVPSEEGARAVDINEFPYTPQDAALEVILANHPLLTDRPDTSKKKSGEGSSGE